MARRLPSLHDHQRRTFDGGGEEKSSAASYHSASCRWRCRRRRAAGAGVLVLERRRRRRSHGALQPVSRWGTIRTRMSRCALSRPTMRAKPAWTSCHVAANVTYQRSLQSARRPRPSAPGRRHSESRPCLGPGCSQNARAVHVECKDQRVVGAQTLRHRAEVAVVTASAQPEKPHGASTILARVPRSSNGSTRRSSYARRS